MFYHTHQNLAISGSYCKNLARLRALDWIAIRSDVRPFVEPGFDPDLLTLENLEWMLD
jgi:hypothetical protein